jgi:hypothetical protein
MLWLFLNRLLLLEAILSSEFGANLSLGIENQQRIFYFAKTKFINLISLINYIINQENHLPSLEFHRVAHTGMFSPSPIVSQVLKMALSSL